MTTSAHLAARADRGRPRHGQDRGRPRRDRGAAVRPGQAADRHRQGDAAAGALQGPRDQHRDRSRRAARWFVGDPHHLRQVLLNLLSNAVKFTEHGRDHAARARDRAERPSASSGSRSRTRASASPRRSRRAIFEPFTQADDSITRVYGGTGLGTTIARQLVMLMGGRDRASSSTSGRREPVLVRAAAPVAPPSRRHRRPHRRARRATRNVARAPRRGRRRVAGAKVHKIRGARILVAEDNPTNQRVDAADPRERRPRPGRSSATATRRSTRSSAAGFDIALFDLSMPVVSGLEALKLYRFTTPRADPGADPLGQRHHRDHRRMQARRRRRIRRQAGARLAAARRDRASPRRRGLDARTHRRAAARRRAAVADRRRDAAARGPHRGRDLAGLSRDPTFVERLVRGFRGDCERLVGEIGERSRQPQLRGGEGRGARAEGRRRSASARRCWCSSQSGWRSPRTSRCGCAPPR